MCFPEYIYFTHKQSYIHTNIHTHILYIHTVLHSYKYISVYWIFFFYYKRQFDILLLCILCYTVRARSLLKSMHFLLVVSRSRVCKQLRVHATRSECHQHQNRSHGLRQAVNQTKTHSANHAAHPTRWSFTHPSGALRVICKYCLTQVWLCPCLLYCTEFFN